jgi:hypothetical protein
MARVASACVCSESLIPGYRPQDSSLLALNSQRLSRSKLQLGDTAVGKGVESC